MIAEDAFAPRLLAWFDQHGRKHLPWQQDINAYRVWVSEIMLQQTQVATVIPYFERFMQRFPNVASLADADIDEVLHYWTGLGYYARARNLHKAAIAVVEQYNGEFPIGVAALTSLPGIGRSTAGAIAAIAQGERAAILDGNVKRVLARCFAIEGWPGQTAVANELWEIAEKLTPQTRFADYTQAIMDLGATICVRSSPKCLACPLEAECIARQTGRVAELPGKKPKKAMPVRSTCMLIIENRAGEYLLQRRPSTGLWGGLWSFPEVEPDDVQEALDRLLPGLGTEPGMDLAHFRHTFTHFHLDVTPVHVKLQDNASQVSESETQCWYSPDAPLEIGLTRPVTKLIKLMRQ